MSETDDRSEREDGRRPGSRYALFVGLAFLALLIVATINTLRTRDDGILGTDAGERGAPLPEFAVPELLGELEGDANVYQRECEAGDESCVEDDDPAPACEIEAEDAIRVCDLFDKPLVISFWFTRGADCLPTQDTLDEVARRYRGRVNFLSINVRDDRDEAREIVRARGWEIPVGYDADGAVSNLYRVGGCPTIAFAFAGGVFADARLGTDQLGEAELTAEIDRLLRDSRRREREGA
jgi:thiol-disulfide isomerase/thioredoxin